MRPRADDRELGNGDSFLLFVKAFARKANKRSMEAYPEQKKGVSIP